MTSKNDVKLFRSVLAIGFLFVLAGLTFIFSLPAHKAEGVLFSIYLALMFIGAVMVYFSLVLHKSLLLYLGLNVFILSVCIIFISSNKENYQLVKYWPLLLISFGVTLIPSGYFRYKKMQTFYVIPAVALVLLGILFSLFAFKIITIKFNEFVIYMWPGIFLTAGAVLIGLYFYGVCNKNKLLEEVDEDEADDIKVFTSGDDEDND